MTGRSETITQKIETPFGSHYCHIEHDGAGRILGLSFSSPGKFASSQIAGLLTLLSEAANQAIADIVGQQ